MSLNPKRSFDDSNHGSRESSVARRLDYSPRPAGNALSASVISLSDHNSVVGHSIINELDDISNNGDTTADDNAEVQMIELKLQLLELKRATRQRQKTKGAHSAATSSKGSSRSSQMRKHKLKLSGAGLGQSRAPSRGDPADATGKAAGSTTFICVTYLPL